MRDRALSMFLTAGTTLFLVAAVGCAVESPTVGQVQTDPDRPGSSGCPNSTALANFLPASNVAAGFSTTGLVTTYRFAAFSDEPPAGGVPGLIKYCVYPNPAAQPSAIEVQAQGANEAAWTSSVGSSAFSFGRPDGNPSNIPLDVPSTTMGTATWSVVPAEQAILLHINDPTVCASLYGGDPGTCFVTSARASTCILDIGETNVAYNAMPFGAADCPGPSWGFEATGTVEFGDEVALQDNTGRELVSLKVLFASYACETGHWHDNTCFTNPTGATFTHPVTANIYSVKECDGAPGTSCPDALLATVTVNQTMPYRPSADPVHCTGSDAGKWFNPVAGVCKTQISRVLTFEFTSQNVTLPDRVIWTVAFNTTHYGAVPIGQGASCYSTSGGCPYDSFNVGVMTFPGAPYAGTDVSVDAAWGRGPEFGPGGVLAPSSGWSDYRPLGEIITTP